MQDIKIERKNVEEVTINTLFGVLSDHYGYDYEEWLDEIIELQTKWENQGYIEIYQTYEDKEWGRVKDSSLAQGASPYYIGLFHARLLNDRANDPLVIIKFHETKTGQLADMKLMVDHDDIFGLKNQKKSPEQLRSIRVQLDKFIQDADLTLT
ncbi:hypothetical protein CXF72_04230 [Psychromonas sp. MB-3u-54]|uniref:hypothetical protein n=1 Tax=Psychromonas sp. MB-3u-54 TaxID=2058319 RepID=UPI000C345841|nr:hypothetical protein [Psychromonas sp. MB-3u-54]PKH03790.1 hypothetical protein CXF72_04230 [Psychromonas sp. MB-3u-54]